MPPRTACDHLLPRPILRAGCWRIVGGSLEKVDHPLRVYLAGNVCLERGEVLLPERALPGPQGRLVVAFLAAESGRPVGRDEIAGELWPEELPRSWETALRSIVSK